MVFTNLSTGCLAVSLTLWAEQAENFDGTGNPIVFMKACRINEFGGGKSVALNQSSTMKFNPDISEAHHLRAWYDNNGQNQNFSSVSSRITGSGFTTDWVNFYEAKARIWVVPTSRTTSNARLLFI